MQTCYNCGKQVPDETLICPDCGALVRRYNTPANPAASAQTAAPAVPLQPQAMPRVRLQGPLRVWLVIQCIVSAYMAFSSLCSVILAANPQVFDMMLSEPGMEALEPMLTTMQEVLPQAMPLFILLTVLFSAKFIGHLWLLISARRLPFYLSIGVSLAGLLCALLMGGTLIVIVYFFDPIITWLGLKRYWPYMRK